MSASQVSREDISSVDQIISSWIFPSNGFVPAPYEPSVKFATAFDVLTIAVCEFDPLSNELLAHDDSLFAAVAFDGSSFDDQIL